MNPWINEFINKQINEKENKQINEQMNKQMKKEEVIKQENEQKYHRIAQFLNYFRTNLLNY